MGRLRTWLGSTCGLAVALVVVAATPASEWTWPLDATPTLTSSFGEPRRTHLHAGIDLGTGGRTGVACRAVGDGWVARLRMSPFGYGKALYVQLDDGPLVVYAHLERFAAPMAERAWDEQVRRRRYTFDVSLERDGRRIACEISVSTDAKHEVGNIQKSLAAGYEQLLVIASNKRLVGRLENMLTESLTAASRERVRVLQPADSVARLGALTLAAGQGVAAEQALPVYVRDDVARPAGTSVTGLS